MSKLLLIICLLFGRQAYSQTGRPGATSPPWKNDSLSAGIASRLGIKKEIADSVLSLIYTSRTAISTVLQNRSLATYDQKARISIIAGTRNAAIAKLLRPEQIDTLKAIMAAEKDKWKQKQ